MQCVHGLFLLKSHVNIYTWFHRCPGPLAISELLYHVTV